MASKSDHDLITEIHGDVKYIRKTVDDHEKRIRKSEDSIGRVKGALSVFVALGTLAIAFVDWFKK